MTPDELEAYIASYVGAPPPPDAPKPAIDLTFIDQPVILRFDPSRIDRSRVSGAVRNLRALPASTRFDVEPSLFAFYCQQMEDGAGNFDTPQEQLDWEADFAKGKPKFVNPRHALTPDQVWPLVHFFLAVVYSWEGRTVVSLWADAAWDGEHGVALHFDNGLELISVTDLNDGPH